LYQKLSKKNDCPHKLGGKSLLTVFKQIGDLKFGLKCSSCGEEIVVKKKQVPTDAQWNI
jgi:hypothetical protein